MSVFALILAATVTVQGTVALPPDSETGAFVIATEEDSLSPTFSARLSVPTPLLPGDRIVAVCEERRSNTHIYWFTQTVKLLGHGPGIDFPQLSAADVNDNQTSRQFGRIRGHVRDAVVDDIDGIWVFLTLDTSDGTILAVAMAGPKAKNALQDLIGAEVELRGHIMPPNPLIARQQFGQTFAFLSLQNLTVLKPRPRSLFDAPDIRNLQGRTPREISASPRHRVRGQVRAVWNRNKVLVCMETGEFATVALSDAAPPAVGDTIEAVGFPETDLYAINLSRGEWRPVSGLNVPPEAPVQRLSTRDLIVDVEGKPVIRARYCKNPVTVCGIVKQVPEGNSTDRVYVEADKRLIAISTDSLPSLPPGFEREATVEVTGVCILETESWRENVIIPRVTDVFLVARSADDLVVLKGPPFWTPARFLTALIALLSVLVLVFAWNATLRVLVTRKSRALLREQIEKSEAEFRVDERTRLAVELHDSVAQDLTSVAMQVETAATLADNASPKIRRILHSATMMLQNCREELRICLWDLRNGSLDERNMEDAIRRMLRPIVGNTALHIRFNVARSHVLDATAHATLRIIRELVSNAIRHGKAQTIRIAGAFEDQHLLFSVTDDGTGFDITTAPGIPQGHFGLTGIRERVRKLNGTLNFKTAPGQGTKVSVSI